MWKDDQVISNMGKGILLLSGQGIKQLKQKHPRPTEVSDDVHLPDKDENLHLKYDTIPQNLLQNMNLLMSNYCER